MILTIDVYIFAVNEYNNGNCGTFSILLMLDTIESKSTYTINDPLSSSLIVRTIQPRVTAPSSL